MFLLLTVPACSLLEKAQDKSSEKMSELIVKYCAETNENFRTQLRDEINFKMAGQATVKVECLPATGEVDNADRGINSSVSNRRGHVNVFYRLPFVQTKQAIRAIGNENIWKRYQNRIVNKVTTKQDYKA